MTKSLRILLVGAALIGALAPALAQSTGGGGNGGGGAGGGGGSGGNGSSNVWDPSIPRSAFNRYPPTHIPPEPPRAYEPQIADTCGEYRGRIYCRPR